MQFASRWRRALGGFVLAGVALAVQPAWAGPNSGKISFTFGTDFTTAYFFRGILQERYGLIMQPYGEVNVPFYTAEEDDPGPFTYVGGFGGIWLSWQSEKTLADDSGPSNLYETDYYGGLKFTLWKYLDLKTTYYAYTFPNGSFPTAQEVTLGAALNDSEWLGAFAVYPSVLFAIETDNTAFGTEEGQYVGIGFRPTYTVDAIENYPISLAMPCTIGLGLDNYYEIDEDMNEDNFGYFQGGFTASVPLAFIPEDFGAWSVSAGVSVYTFGRNLDAANQGQDPWVVGTWGFSMAY